MKVLGRYLLDEFVLANNQGKNPLDAWERKMKRNTFQNFMELRQIFPKADYVYHRYTIFNIGGNKYRLITRIDYFSQDVLVLKIWTHAKYDKKKNQDLLREKKL